MTDDNNEDYVEVGVEVETPSSSQRQRQPFKISSSMSQVLYDWDDEKLEDDYDNHASTAASSRKGGGASSASAGLDINRVFDKMDTLRMELKQEQQRASGLKKALVLVCGLTFLLTVSNISTSLVAVQFASNANGSAASGLDASGVQQMIAATPKYFEVKIDPIKDDDVRRLNPSHRRHLEESAAIACGRGNAGGGAASDPEATTGEDDNDSHAVCELVGRMSYDDAVHLYQQFCPPWPFTVTTTDGDGTSTTTTVEQSCISDENGGIIPGAYINCGDHITYIKGGIHFPPEHPEEIDDEGWVAFPSAKGGPYQAELTVREPSLPRIPANQASGPSWTSGSSASFTNPIFDETCTLSVNIKMYCKIDDPKYEDCEVFFSYRPNQCKGHVDFCAPSTI